MSEIIKNNLKFTLNEDGKNIIAHGNIQDYCYINSLLEKVTINVYFDVHSSEKFEERTFNHPYIPLCFSDFIEKNINGLYPHKSCQ